MVTFVLAIYALATLAHISNISAVTGPIFTVWTQFCGVHNFCGPKCSWTKHLQTQFFLRHKFFSDPKSFQRPTFLDQQIYWTQKIFKPQIFFSDTIFFENFFRHKLYLVPKIFGPTISLDQKFLDPKFFWTFDFFSDQIFVWGSHGHTNERFRQFLSQGNVIHIKMGQNLMSNLMECLIMTYGRDFEPMAEIFF